jgi:hypothetical protein
VWAELGRAPLAHAVALLGDLAAAATDVAGHDVATAAAWYAERGHLADRLALETRAVVTHSADREAVRAALHAVYDPWADRTARAFQSLIQAESYPGVLGLDVEPGTCVVYVDALRVDLGHRLGEKLAPRRVEMGHRLAAFPTVTPAGQPAVAPVDEGVRAGWRAGHDFDAADEQGRSLTGALIRKALTAAGVECLPWDGGLGDPTGVAWIPTNDIDSAGHATKGGRFEDVIDELLNRVAARIEDLLTAGWRRVLVVTDHGFLFPGRPARKVELPLAVTAGGSARKPRVARLRDGAPAPAFPTAGASWDQAVTMVSAPGTTAFEEGVNYDHGGLSLQECVIPQLTVFNGSPAEGALTAQIDALKWTGQRCRVDVVPPEPGLAVEVRLSPGDPHSRIGGPKKTRAGEAKVLVDDDTLEGQAAYVVLLDQAGAVIAQRETIIGGS